MGTSRQRGAPLAQRKSTSAGPTENHDEATQIASRSSGVRRRSDVRQLAEDQAGADDEREHAGRQQEPHRDEDRLRRHGEDAAELEPHPSGERVTADADDEREERDGPVRRKGERAERDDEDASAKSPVASRPDQAWTRSRGCTRSASSSIVQVPAEMRVSRSHAWESAPSSVRLTSGADNPSNEGTPCPLKGDCRCSIPGESESRFCGLGRGD